MLDFNHFANSSQIKDWRVFNAAQSAGTTTDSWQTWTKPRGASFVYGLIFAAGGAGGTPNTGAVSAGGGGASGAVATFMIPAYYLPDILYVRPGMGGVASLVANNPGGNGDTSYLCTQPNINNESVLITAAAGSGGAASATGGVAGVIAVFSNQLTLAVTNTSVGIVGGAGGTSGNNGTQINWGNGGPPISPGTGGGGGNAAAKTGGTLNVTGGAGVAPFASLLGVSAGDGPDGHGFNKPVPDLRNPHSVLPYLAISGGVGGGASNGGTGGKGGRGAYGCGGGGGGGGNTQGNGGNGGDALIILIAW